jgi:uncharacterized protein (TIGR02246 family)
VSPHDAPTPLVDVLVERVAELERTQRGEDVAGFLSLFDPDAVWVTGGGRRLVGLDEITEFTRTVLPGAFADGGSVRYEVDHVLIISSEVVLTGVEQQYVATDGAETGRGLPTYVWRLAGGEWRIIAGQNTTVPDDASV